MSASDTLGRMVGQGHACLSLARVAKHEGETAFWAVNADGDLEVQVIAHQHETPITALLGPQFGWFIPAEGTEVLVAHAEGDFEGDAVLVAALPTGDVPGDLSPSTYVIRVPAGGKVHVHDGSGQAPLATLADVQALRDYVATQFLPAGHTHAVSGSATTSVVAIAPGAPVPEGATAPDNPSGTEVLEAR